MSLIDEQHAFLMDVAKLFVRADALGYVITGGELWRTAEQEQWDVQHGLSKTMQSNHLRRLAIDLNFFKDGNLVAPGDDVAAYWEGLSPLNRWGGHFTDLNDPSHFERNAP